jgi:hypothetical protein
LKTSEQGQLMHMHVSPFACQERRRDIRPIEENFNPMNSNTFVLFGKYCLIMDQLGSKDSSRDFQLNCVISYFFTYI